MQVRDVLSFKLVPGVAWIRPDMTVAEEVAQLGPRRIGALVVSPDGCCVDGLVTERDIVRDFARRGPQGLDRRVAEIMARGVPTCHPEDDAEHVVSCMMETGFGHMPVMQNGCIVALVSLGDMVRACLHSRAEEIMAAMVPA